MMTLKSYCVLGSFSALSIISVAQAHEVDDDSGESYDSGEWGEWGESSTEDELDEHEEVLMDFWQAVLSITVSEMPFNPPEGDFDCDDYAWCFDDTCEQLNIESWELLVGCRETFAVSHVPQETGYELYCLDEITTGARVGCWYQLESEAPVIPDYIAALRDKRNGSHVMNIIKVPSPPDSDVDQYCIIEPQSNEVAVCWTQEAIETEPIVPIEAKFTLQQYLVDNYSGPDGALCQESSIMITDIFEGGHYFDLFEAPFTYYPDVVDLYERVTGMCAPTF